MSIDQLPTELHRRVAGYLHLDDVVRLSGASRGLRPGLSLDVTALCLAYRSVAGIDGSAHDGPPRFRHGGNCYVHYGFEIPSSAFSCGSAVHSVRVTMKCKDIFKRSVHGSRCRFIVGKKQTTGALVLDDIGGVVLDRIVSIGKVASDCYITFPVPINRGGESAYHLWYKCEDGPVKLEFMDVRIQYISLERTLAKAISFLVTSQVISSMDYDESQPGGTNDTIDTHEILARSRAHTVQSTLDRTRQMKCMLEKGEPIPSRMVYLFRGHRILTDELTTELMDLILSIANEWDRSRRTHEVVKREASEKRAKTNKRRHVTALPPVPVAL